MCKPLPETVGKKFKDGLPEQSQWLQREILGRSGIYTPQRQTGTLAALLDPQESCGISANVVLPRQIGG